MDEIEEMNLNELGNRSSRCEITDTLCQGVHHEVSVQPTLHDQGLMVFCLTRCSSRSQISTTTRDLGAPHALGAGNVKTGPRADLLVTDQQLGVRLT